MQSLPQQPDSLHSTQTAPLAVFKLQHPALLLIGPDHKHELEAGVSLLVWAARTVARASMTTCRGTKKKKKKKGGGGRTWVEPEEAKVIAGSWLLGRGVRVHASRVSRAVEVDVLPLGVLSVPNTSLLCLSCVWNARPVDVLHQTNVSNAGSIIP